ncbi:MAG: hypothetical protein H8D87_01700 [Deltaproteobacteria bacterium]|uniref:hypothetical protein n=1 Tax=Desulfobacula sp. TaxID=2593537 RepID=UPI0019A47A1D|nr:hypothetical protein [Candidatus Desulfobacula maris]MBL6995419.1 hypothetical protein [Desulfobacula sp.]
MVIRCQVFVQYGLQSHYSPVQIEAASIIKSKVAKVPLQVGFDAGAKRILIPMSSVGDIPAVPGELFAKF